MCFKRENDYIIAGGCVHAQQGVKNFVADSMINTCGNPLFRHIYTADPAAMVYKGKPCYLKHDGRERSPYKSAEK